MGDRKGRPTRLTPAIQEAICALLRQGMHLSPAAEKCGIPDATVLDWVQRGEGHPRHQGLPRRPELIAFAVAVREAIADAEAKALALVMAVAWGNGDTKPDWKAAAWFLERRFPERWRRRDEQQLTGAGGQPLPVVKIEVVQPRDNSPTGHAAVDPGTSLPTGNL